MALSGSLTTGSKKDRSVTLNWSAKPNVAANKSVVSWSVVGSGTASGYVVVSELRVTINGSQVYYRNSDNHTNCYVDTPLASGTVDIPHNDDGTKSFDIKIEAGIYDWAINTSATKSFTLDTIPRASVPTVSASTVTMGNSVIIYTNSKASSFTHKITVTLGGETVATWQKIYGSTEWKVDDLVRLVPNALKGTATITCTTYTDANQTKAIGTKNCTITVKVPAATTPTLPTSTSSNPKYAGDVITITLPRKSSNFTHKLNYEFGNEKGTIGSSLATSKSWTIPYTLCSQIPAAWSGTITITCFTYNGTAVVGTKFASLYFKVPDNSTTKPKISSISIAPITSLEATVDKDLVSTFKALYIQGHSKVKANYTTSAPYSLFESVEMTVQSKSVTGTKTTATSEFLNSSGTNVSVSFKVKNMRGQTGTGSTTISAVHAYSKPLVDPLSGYTKALCYRSDESGNEDTGGISLAVKAQRKYWDLGGNNTCRLWYKFKVYDGLPIPKDTDETPLLDYGETGSFDGVINGALFNNEKSYTVEIGVTDKMGNTNSIAYFIATSKATFHLAKGGKGAAFGGYSKGDGLEVPWKSTFTGAVQGNAFGLGVLLPIPDGSDINQYTTPGVYAVSKESAETILNLPIEKEGRLIVSSSDGSGKSNGENAHILQEYVTYDGHYHYYRMVHTDDTADEWKYDKWRCHSSTDWQDLGLSTNVSPSNYNYGKTPGGCTYRVVDENHVYVAFNCKFTYSGESVIINQNMIPEKYRPKRPAYNLCALGGRNIARVYAHPNGYIVVSWVQAIPTAASTTSLTVEWIDGYVDYWI